jgi:hypothetical protein
LFGKGHERPDLTSKAALADVSFCMGSAQGVACPLRDMLASQYDKMLSCYHQAMLSLLEDMTIDKAAQETHELYHACTEVRDELRSHERKHGCC